VSEHPEVALIEFLKADSAVNTLTAGRIFGDELPANQIASMPRKCIVIEASGGAQSFGNAYQEYGDGRYDVRSYGETPYEAALVQRAIYRALKHLDRGVHAGLLLHWAKRSGGPLSLRDPDTSWPYRFESYQVLVGEVEIVGG
jgi:hypothetical protein